MSAAANEKTIAPSSGGPLGTVPEVSEFLSLSRSKIYELMDSGLLPYAKFGRSRRVPWAEVQRLVERSLVSR